jgi:DNA-binding transcriptional LysR family regulator
VNAPVLSLVDLHIIRGLAAGKTQAEIGAELHLEQPSISKMLRACEERTGLTIVAPVGRRLGLSDAGREIALAAERALDAFAALERYAADVVAARAGSLRFVTSSTPGSYVLPELVAAFSRERPALEIEMEIVPVSGMWEVFESEEFDFAIAPELGMPPDLRARRLYDDPVVFFAPPSAPIASRPAVRFEDLANETLIGKFVDAHWRAIFRSFEQRGFRALRTVTIVPPEGVKRMVAERLGVGALLESSVQRELEAGSFVRLPIADPSLEQHFCFATRRSDVLSPAAEAFLAYLDARLAPARRSYAEPESPASNVEL